MDKWGHFFFLIFLTETNIAYDYVVLEAVKVEF